MTHYVCTGNCGGEADRPGECHTEGCTKEDQPLVECNCEDGMHEVVKEDSEGETRIDQRLSWKKKEKAGTFQVRLFLACVFECNAKVETGESYQSQNQKEVLVSDEPKK